MNLPYAPMLVKLLFIFTLFENPEIGGCNEDFCERGQTRIFDERSRTRISERGFVDENERATRVGERAATERGGERERQKDSNHSGRFSDCAACAILQIDPHALPDRPRSRTTKTSPLLRKISSPRFSRMRSRQI